MRRFRRARHLAQLAAVAAARSLLGLLPLAARRRVCSGLARAASPLLFGDRARRNLETAFGASLARGKRGEIQRANARAVGRMIAELVEYRRDGAGTARRLVFIDGTLEHLDAALGLGRGAILVTPHFGNWELFPAYLATRGYHGAVVGRRPANAYLAEELISMRARAGVETLDALGSPRALLRVLDSGGILGMLPDLDSKRASGVFVPFFGRPAYTPTGPAGLAVSSQTPLLTAYMIPEGKRYRLTFEPAILPDAAAPRREEIQRITEEWSRRFESRIRERPELWVWMHDRWATTPEKLEERRRRRPGRRGNP
jgi:Kdo2-lipid IVA lauroyltransferase/acyltransferase